jgi:hypothetical protein
VIVMDDILRTQFKQSLAEELATATRLVWLMQHALTAGGAPAEIAEYAEGLSVRSLMILMQLDHWRQLEANPEPPEKASDER